MVRAGKVANVSVSNCSFSGVGHLDKHRSRAAIFTDHTTSFRFSENEMGWLGRGIQLTFSSIGFVSNNTVHDVAGHGIQFWCNWNFQTQACHTLSFIGNHVRNASGGADIWGTGAVGMNSPGR